MEEIKKKRKILIASIEEDLHKQVKSLSSFRGINIRQWVEIAIKELIKKEMETR